MDDNNDQRGTLRIGEPHPAAQSAARYLVNMDINKRVVLLGSLSSAAIEGNRWAEICHETWDRLIWGKPVSDRYVLGLAWTVLLLEMEKITVPPEPPHDHH